MEKQALSQRIVPLAGFEPATPCWVTCESLLKRTYSCQRSALPDWAIQGKVFPTGFTYQHITIQSRCITFSLNYVIMLREVRLYCHLLYTQTNQPHLRFTWNIAGIYLLFLCCLWQSAEIDLISYDWKFRFCCYMRVVPQVFRLMYIFFLSSPIRAGDALSLSSWRLLLLV